MTLHNLQVLHQEMKGVSQTVETFEYSYNNVSCSCIFDADYQNGFSITFIKKSLGTVMKLPIKPGYRIQIQGELFPIFCNFFEIKRGKGLFSMKEFISHFNNHIPTVLSKNTPEKRKLIATIFQLEEADKIYYDHLINWEKIRVQNPNNKCHRSKENLEKTKKLYPDIYKTICNHDISVAYSSTQK